MTWTFVAQVAALAAIVDVTLLMALVFVDCFLDSAARRRR